MASKMTATEVTERINKTQEAISKLNTLIYKRKKELPKAQKELAKWDKETNWKEWFDAHYKVRTLEDGIEGGQKKLEEKQKTLDKWNKKLEEINAVERKLDEIPEQLKKMQEELAQKIINYDMNRRKFLREKYNEMSYKEFCEEYGWNAHDYYLTRSDEDFEKMVIKDANAEAKEWVLDLIYRVEKKVGEITRWYVYFSQRCLNGYVEGTKGSVKIDTIIAGGYNIQCRHTRVLVR